MKLFRDTLVAVHTLHQAGYMHRDISSRNILILRLEPIPAAAVCDYGKVTREQTSANTYIGPHTFLPPEVPTNPNSKAPKGGGTGVNKTGRYDRSIDIWSLAYTWCRVILPDLPLDRVDQSLFQRIKLGLEYWAGEDKRKSEFARLLVGMLAWDPVGRTTAGEALQHPGMAWANNEWAEVSSARGREKVGDKRSRSE